jgi:hypothetical protein
MSSGFWRLGANVPNKNLDGIVAPVTRLTPEKVPEEEIPSSGVPALAETMTSYPMSPGVARAIGFTGDQCPACNSMRLKYSGHCQVCTDCGETTGCS